MPRDYLWMTTGVVPRTEVLDGQHAISVAELVDAVEDVLDLLAPLGRHGATQGADELIVGYPPRAVAVERAMKLRDALRVDPELALGDAFGKLSKVELAGAVSITERKAAQEAGNPRPAVALCRSALQCPRNSSMIVEVSAAESITRRTSSV